MVMTSERGNKTAERKLTAGQKHFLSAAYNQVLAAWLVT
jgi:hypothetical protein